MTDNKDKYAKTYKFFAKHCDVAFDYICTHLFESQEQITEGWEMITDGFKFDVAEHSAEFQDKTSGILASAVENLEQAEAKIKVLKAMIGNPQLWIDAALEQRGSLKNDQQRAL